MAPRAVRTPRLAASPLAVWERDGLAAALAKAGLATDDLRDPGQLFWRFQTDDIPLGFGGLEVYGDAALLQLELEIPPHCRAVYLMTQEAAFFEALGYAGVAPSKAPRAIRASRRFAGRPPDAVLMMKRIG